MPAMREGRPRQSARPARKGKAAAFKNEPAEIHDVVARYSQTDFTECAAFADYPISRRTQSGLQSAGFVDPTDIQRQTVGLALRGLDILGAAKTGSGKTLAFVIPLLELLWRHRWSPHVDGLGALVITPTRELAYQIFDVIRKVGGAHDFSAALLVGGNHVGYERARIGAVNVAVGTPGRLLQHMDTSPNFDAVGLKLLVLDEADRCLDMGFERQLNAIIDNLPKDRQTLLFSATQTKSVKDLARLSLKDPVYVSAHEKATHSTPDALVQNYVVCPDEDKVNFLFSFLRSHVGRKTLVFMTACRQVRYMADAFVKLRTGVKVLCLHGKVNAAKRIKVYEQFCRQENVALFATDVAARGLDFPAVDWVLQLDCPCDAGEYIHRAGRTARYDSKGRALLVLTRSQKKAMLEQLAGKRIPITGIKPDRSKLFNASAKLESILAQDANLKAFAQRCVVSYMKSIFMMSNKHVFDATSVDIEAYARSLGLVTAPRVRFMRKQQQRQQGDSAGSRTAAEDDRNNAGDFTAFGGGGDASDSDGGGGGALFSVKRTVLPEADEEEPQASTASSEQKQKVLSKRTLAKKALRQIRKVPDAPAAKKIVFGDSEAEKSDGGDEDGPSTAADAEPTGGIDLEASRRALAAADADDRRTHRERMRAARQERKRKLKARMMEAKRGRRQVDEAEARLGSASDSGGEGADLSWLPDPDRNRDSDGDDRREGSDNDYAAVDKEELGKREVLARKLLGLE